MSLEAFLYSLNRGRWHINYLFYSFHSTWNIAFSHAEKRFLQATRQASCCLTPGAPEYSIFPASPPQHARAALPWSSPLAQGTHGDSWPVEPRQPTVVHVHGKVSSVAPGPLWKVGEFRNVNFIPARQKTQAHYRQHQQENKQIPKEP